MGNEEKPKSQDSLSIEDKHAVPAEFDIEIYREIVESSPNLIRQSDLEGRYTFLNKEWKKTFGYRVQEMLGRKFTDFISPKPVQQESKTFATLLHDGTVQDCETVYLHKNGSEVWLSFNTSYVKAKDGRILGTRGIAYDITERKRAEADLAESRQRYREMVMHSPMGMHFYDLEGDRLIFSDFNPAADRLLGVSNAQFQISKNKMAAVFLEITNRKRAEEALKNEKERVSVTLRSIGDGVIATDVAGRVTLMNKVAEAMTGWSALDAVGRPLREILIL